MMHNDLISRETVLEALRARGRELLKLGTSFEANIASIAALECVNIVKDAPVVDAAPVVHGRWTGNYMSHCSVCDCFDVRAYIGQYSNYCPNCGARMDKEEEKHG